MVSPLLFRLFAVSGSQGTRRGPSGLVRSRPPARQGDILPESGARGGGNRGLHILHTTQSYNVLFPTTYCALDTFTATIRPTTDTGLQFLTAIIYLERLFWGSDCVAEGLEHVSNQSRSASWHAFYDLPWPPKGSLHTSSCLHACM